MTVKEVIAALEHYPPELPVWGVTGVAQLNQGGVAGVTIHREITSQTPSPAPQAAPHKKPLGKSR